MSNRLNEIRSLVESDNQQPFENRRLATALRDLLRMYDALIRDNQWAGGELVKAQQRIQELEGQLKDPKWNEEALKLFLLWREIETPCTKCGGTGWRAYGDTSTWRGGVGGQAISGGVCDHCWGSGDEKKHWADQRLMRSVLDERDRLRDKIDQMTKEFETQEFGRRS